MDRTYSIRELVKEFGVTARTLRHYEHEGLIAPERRGQSRLYSARDRARISLILRGRRVGFTLAEIGEGLALYNQADGGTAQLVHARQKFAARIAALERQKTDLEESLVELRLGLAMIDNKLAERREHERPPPIRLQHAGFAATPADD